MTQPCGIRSRTDVPAKQVDEVAASYWDDQALAVQVTSQSATLFTVTATFPPCADGSRPLAVEPPPSPKGGGMQVAVVDHRAEYESLYASCIIDPGRVSEVRDAANQIANNRAVYDHLERATGVPWHVVGFLHYRECGFNPNTHLYNGDPLQARTVHDTKNRPMQDSPTGLPYGFEFSAECCLHDEGFASWSDWSVAGTLYRCELFNGMGCRNNGVNSPYLWGFTQHYTGGGFPTDGHFVADWVSKQCGYAGLRKWMDTNARL